MRERIPMVIRRLHRLLHFRVMLPADKKSIFLRIRNHGGLTIPEVLIVAALFSLLFGACLMIFVSGSDSWQVNRIKIEVQQEVRKAIEAIKADLVQGGSSTVDVPADDSWYTAITFKVPSGV